MNAQQRLALRTAQVLHEAFSCRAAHGRYLALPDAAWASCRRLVHLTNKAKLRGWAGAQQKLEQHFIRSVAECVDELVQVRHRLEDWHGASDVASERDIFADLLALNTEFEAVQIDIRKTTIYTIIETGLQIAFIAIFWYHLKSLTFKWDDNAYASIYWISIILTLIFTAATVFEGIYIIIQLIRGLYNDERHWAIEVDGLTNYVGIAQWILVYLTIFISPYIMK